MAARPGEENVATLFADIHYFYGPDTVKPRHHRFDKGSYVYLFENANERRCRIEIANQPGTEDQDAFEGYLDQTHVRYSYKQQCNVTLTGPEAVADQNEWHLPTFDPQNQNKYHYKLHSLDIYFWTQTDALQFVNGVRRVAPPSHVEVLDEPGPPPQPAPMSSVVQQLENVAISDPQYGSANAPSFAPPPNVAVPPPAPPSEAPASFAPMAYNPAAPAAPETIQHREKTPPPDEDPLNPLAVAVAYDYHKQPFTPGMPPPSQFPPGGVTSPGLPPPQFGQHPGLQRAATMPAQALGSPYGATFPGSPGFVSPPPPPQTQPLAQTQPHSQPTPPASNPGLPPPPPGGFTQYNYTHQEQQVPTQPGAEYSIHQQVYRPTQTELANSEIYSFAPKTKEPRGKLEENAGRLERGVTGMLKKFEKKFG
ncbi:uncharacterized protein FPRO_00521 [Fusarium proliferatum ET1]|uniref:Related to hydroxyproline-rich glycoprotein n=1 Tax=Fusarium proliferatum (strain ET1) TaxID=1227346 RepID=A0A1L7V756_FUSPR|nr:uncharacterized protein FPRO_00521 [Fusarium proliferatum ET1]CZR35356.1 related to hydroxyproline-rich glycoprotein precursor [Fusarium proliferatum ET1]